MFVHAVWIQFEIDRAILMALMPFVYIAHKTILLHIQVRNIA